MDYVRLGKNIRELRKSKKLTQEKLAELCGCSISFLGHIERGTRKLSVETLCHIADALDCSTDALLGLQSRQEKASAEQLLRLALILAGERA